MASGKLEKKSKAHLAALEAEYASLKKNKEKEFLLPQKLHMIKYYKRQREHQLGADNRIFARRAILNLLPEGQIMQRVGRPCRGDRNRPESEIGAIRIFADARDIAVPLNGTLASAAGEQLHSGKRDWHDFSSEECRARSDIAASLELVKRIGTTHASNPKWLFCQSFSSEMLPIFSLVWAEI